MNIHDYPNLCANLGAPKVDRISHHAQVEYEPGSKRVRVVINPHRKRLMWNQKPPAHVDDILSGIARLDYGSTKPLSASRLFVMLQSAERISSELLSDVMRIEERQARRYMAAAKLAIFHLNRHYHHHPEAANDE